MRPLCKLLTPIGLREHLRREGIKNVRIRGFGELWHVVFQTMHQYFIHELTAIMGTQGETSENSCIDRVNDP